MITLNKGQDVCDITGWEDEGGNIPEVSGGPMCDKCYLRHGPDENPFCEDSTVKGSYMWRMVATEEEIAAYEAEQESKKAEPVVNPAAKKDGRKRNGLKELSWQESTLAGASILAAGAVLVVVIYVIGELLNGALALLQSIT